MRSPSFEPPDTSRRAVVFVVTGVLLLALIAVASLLPAPYSVEGPGPTENTLGGFGGTPVLKIEGRRTYPTDGQLLLTTVTATACRNRITVWEALRGWVDPQREVVPRRLVCPAGSTPQQLDQQNVQLMSRSQESAKVAALRQIGLRVPEVVVVDAVTDGTPAVGKLRPGDRIVSVDGRTVTRPDQVGRAVRSHQPGEPVEFGLRRSGKPVTVRVTTEARTVEGKRVAAVGIEAATGFDFPVDIEVTLGEDIGGPSAGLMFALGIVDKLTPGDLTRGQTVAGTGEISVEGKVGAIGGIEQKVYGAEAAGASVFLAPGANCADLAGVSTDLRIVRVDTLAGAVDALTAVADERTDLPTCQAPTTAAAAGGLAAAAAGNRPARR